MAWAHWDGRTQEPGRDLGEEHSGHRDGGKSKLGAKEGLRKGGAPVRPEKQSREGEGGGQGGRDVVSCDGEDRAPRHTKTACTGQRTP